MNAIGIFGGTFDPVHHGHLLTALNILEKRNLEKIIFMPCYVSPHKTNVLSASAHHRMEMLKLAIQNIPKFEFSDYEIKKGDVSFSYDTLLAMKKIYSNIELIIGYDNLVVFDTWKQPDKILETAKLIVMKRSHDIGKKISHGFDKKAFFVDTPTIDISSTEIRERVKNKLPINYFVPVKVADYIFTNNLYR